MQHKNSLVNFGNSCKKVPFLLLCCPYLPFEHLEAKKMQNQDVLTIKEVAALLKVGEKTIYSMAQSGELPAFKVRGQWRFSRRDIDAWIEKQKNTTQDIGE
jgi:excisionase family DNA binding protein